MRAPEDMPSSPWNPPSDDKWRDGCVGLVMMFVAYPLLVLLEGWIFHVVWNWFVPGVTDWATIGVAQGVGLATLVGVVTIRIPDKADDPSAAAIRSAYMHLYGYVILLVTAYVAHWAAS